jgi:hypothetical protein
VTNRENTLRGDNMAAQHARQTHCLRGHPLIADNLVGTPSGRRCLTCHNARNRAVRARNYTPTGRGRAALRTHCKAGHEYTEQNTYRTREGHRQCRTCHRERQRAYGR